MDLFQRRWEEVSVVRWLEQALSEAAGEGFTSVVEGLDAEHLQGVTVRHVRVSQNDSEASLLQSLQGHVLLGSKARVPYWGGILECGPYVPLIEC